MTSDKKTNLFHKDFVLVVIGQIISLFGNGIIRFALPLYILDQSGSPALFGIVSASAFVPMIVMSLVGGIVADRVNKKKIMVALDFSTAALITAFIILMGWFSVIPLIVIVLMVLYGIQGAYQPAVQASMPLLMVEKQLVSANAVINLVNSMAQLLGPVIGGILYGVYGLPPILYVSVACFLFSAVLELFIKIPDVKKLEGGAILHIVKTDMSVSMKFLFKENTIILKLTFVIFFFNIFLSAMLIVGIPVIVTQYLGLSSQLYGIANGALAAGGICGGLFAGVFGRKVQVEHAYIYLLIAAIGIFPIAAAVYFHMPVMVSFVLVAGSAFVIMIAAQAFTIQMLSFVQAQTPVEIIGRVISCIMALCFCAQPIGQAIYGLLFERFLSAPAGVVLIAAIISIFLLLYSKSIFGTLKNVVVSHDAESDV